VDDEPNILLCFRRAFRDKNLRVLTAETAAAGLQIAAAENPDVTILDLCLPDGSGVDVFRELRRRDPKALIIFATAHGTTDGAIEAIKEGAYDYLLKPLEVAHMRTVVDSAFRIRHMMHVPARFPDSAGSSQDGDVIVGRCAVMQAVYKSIGRAAPQNVNVLILGESGTGKELVAQALYHHSRRSDRPFLAVNCAAIPETLLESELFGHEQGAFTGADRRRIGKFEQCDGGTLFLDEIGELSMATQAKLLRVLQDRTFQPLGGNQTLQVDVRVIAATNRNLEAMIEAGTFRPDLYFRLADFTISLPPLRERKEDLRDLARHILKRTNQELGTGIDVIPDETFAILSDYDWPGNVRELQNMLRSSLLHATGHVLLPEFLPQRLHDHMWGSNSGRHETPAADDDFRRVLQTLLDAGEPNLYHAMTERLDRLVLEVLMEHTGGNQVQMSRLLGITRNTLRSKMRSLGLLHAAAAEPDESSVS